MPLTSEPQCVRAPRLVSSNRLIAFWIMGVSAMLAAGACIYYRMFTGFAPYDDEGYVLIGIRSLLKGHRLYDEVYSQYGPFYYLAHWVFYSVLGQPVSHDVERLVGVALWLLAATLWGRTLYLLTDSPLWSGFGFLLGVRLLGFFPSSAGHPEEICMALLSGIAVLACIPRPVKAGVNVALACLIAALALTKVNIGLYVAFAIGLFLLKASAQTPFQRFALVLLSFASLILPAAVMFPMLGFTWAREYAFVATASIVAAILMAGTVEPLLHMTRRTWRTVVSAFLGCALLIILPFYFRGTTLTALLQMTVLQHAGSAPLWYGAAPVTFKAVLWSVASLTVFAVAYMRRRGLSRGPIAGEVASPAALAIPDSRPQAVSIRARGRNEWVDFGILGLKIVVGLTCTFVLVQDVPPTNSIIFRYCVPFAWLVLIPPADEGAHHTRGGRIALCFLAVFVYLYAYPVAGSQVAFANVPAGMVAIVLLRDATLGIANSLPAEWMTPRVSRIGAAFGFVLLAALFSRELRDGYRPYAQKVSLGMPGATLIRVEPEEAATYRWITSNAGSCTSLYSMPGMFSLNMWLAQDPPTNLNLGNWVGLLNASQQRAVSRDLSRYQGMCIVYNPAVVEFWRRGQDLRQSPLAQYIQGEFVPVAESGGYYLMKRKTSLQR